MSNMHAHMNEFNSDLGYFSTKLLHYDGKNGAKGGYYSEITPRILRVLCQQPCYTGSGVTLVQLVKQTKKTGLEQFILFGRPAGGKNPFEEIINVNQTLAVVFRNGNTSEGSEIPFPVAGMSDEMPYRSTKFSEFDLSMLETYLSAFAFKIQEAVEKFHPNIIHAHHLWLVTSLCRLLCPELPVIGHCHNTALRQLVLAKQLKKFVVQPIRDLDMIILLNENQKTEVINKFALNQRPIIKPQLEIIGTGIDTGIFQPTIMRNSERGKTKKIIYVGKLSFAKGVPQLIQAYEQLMDEFDGDCELILVESGAGAETNFILKLIENSKGSIKYLGQLDQHSLAAQLRNCDLFILPSFYEGIPLVLLEAIACGCLGIVTDLPGLQDCLEKTCNSLDRVEYLDLPEMESIDKPKRRDLPSFVENLKELMKKQLSRSESRSAEIITFEKIRDGFGWDCVFNHYKKIYNSLIKK